jgi:hypothetical protein
MQFQKMAARRKLPCGAGKNSSVLRSLDKEYVSLLSGAVRSPLGGGGGRGAQVVMASGCSLLGNVRRDDSMVQIGLPERGGGGADCYGYSLVRNVRDVKH